MSAVGDGPGRADTPGRAGARRGGWTPLGRRTPAEADPAGVPAVPGDAALRAVAVRTPEPAVEEHHLGERLSAFVDGELGHDSRDRVQAHLATCPQCLAEADEGRHVKHLLTNSGMPGPSTDLMARLLAVGALPDDTPAPPSRHDDDLPGPGGPVAAGGTLGGSRLTGGSFGRGAGSSFGAGALGADAPLPGVDPRAFGRGSVLRPLIGRRGAPSAPARPEPAAAAAHRPVPPRGRRLVFAAAGAFSVAAVTLGGVGGVGAQTGGGEQRGTSVRPAGGNGGYVPMNAQVPVDLPVRPVSATRSAVTPTPHPDGAPRTGLAGLHHEER